MSKKTIKRNDLIEKIRNAGSDIKKIIIDLSWQELEIIIEEAKYCYYNQSDVIKPLVDNDIYDILIEKLEYLRPNSKLLSEVGSTIDSDNKVNLEYYMGSMNKLADEDKILRWTETYQGSYVISDKLDGISCLMIIDVDKHKNVNIKLRSRGKSTIGTDISHLAKYINHGVTNKIIKNADIHLHLSCPFTIAVRGELIMSIENYEKFSNQASARGAVSGIVTAKPKNLDKRRAQLTDLICYEMLSPPDFTMSEQMEILENLQLNVVNYSFHTEINMLILDEIFKDRRTESNFDIDGIIISDDNSYERITDGNPPYAFAYKGPRKINVTTVKNVIWNASKDGLLNPIVNYKTVKVGKIELNNATGFNANFILQHKISTGSEIQIVYQADTIPYLIDVIKPGKAPYLPESSDDMEWYWDDNHVFIFLVNPDNNSAVKVMRLVRFVKKIGAKFWDEGTMKKIVNAGYENILDLIKIKVDELTKIPGIELKLAIKLYRSLVNALSNITMNKLISGSNCLGRGFDDKKIKKVLNKYPDIIDEFENNTEKKWIKLISEIDGFAYITAERFVSQLPKLIEFYDEFISILENPEHGLSHVIEKLHTQDDNATIIKAFANKTIVFTNVPRSKEWEKIIEDSGGNVLNSVSKKTSMVVYGTPGSSKYKKAVELSIELLTMEEFGERYFNEN